MKHYEIDGCWYYDAAEIDEELDARDKWLTAAQAENAELRRAAAAHLESSERLVSALLLRAKTHAEQAVLDAMSGIPDINIDMTLDLVDDLSVQEVRMWEAVQALRREQHLARRAEPQPAPRGPDWHQPCPCGDQGRPGHPIGRWCDEYREPAPVSGAKE